MVSKTVLTNAEVLNTIEKRMVQFKLCNVGTTPERIDRRNDIIVDGHDARWDQSHCTSMKNDHSKIKKGDVLQWQANINMFLPKHCLLSMVQGPMLLFLFGYNLVCLKPTGPRYKKRQRKQSLPPRHLSGGRGRGHGHGYDDGNKGNNDNKGGTAHSVWSRNLTKEVTNQLRAGLTDTVENGTHGEGIIAQSMIALLGLKDYLGKI